MTKKFLLFVGAFALLTSVLMVDVKKDVAETPPEPSTMPSKGLVASETEPDPWTMPSNDFVASETEPRPWTMPSKG